MPIINHNHISAFADRAVNLPRERRDEHLAQVKRLRERVATIVSENPKFELRKMLLSGSLAKHTALKNINDADVAVYLQPTPENENPKSVASWLAQKLREASFPNINPDQIQPQQFSVRFEFRGSGLDVDVVPVYCDEDKGEDWGYLVSRTDGSKLKTNIKRHQEFIRNRRKMNPDFAQVARLIKWWIRMRKQVDANFKFKSFLAELILAKLVDEGKPLNDYPEAMALFFNYIAKTGLAEQISFRDYANEAGIPKQCNDPIRVFDPVNPDNNVARQYGESDRMAIVNAAIESGDAVDAALYAPNKGLAVHYWRTVLGSSFNG